MLFTALSSEESGRVEDVGVNKKTLWVDVYEDKLVTPRASKIQRRMTDFLENKSAKCPQHLLSSVPRTLYGEISRHPVDEEMSERPNTYAKYTNGE